MQAGTAVTLETARNLNKGARVNSLCHYSGRRTGGTVQDVSGSACIVYVLWDSTTTGHVSRANLRRSTGGFAGRDTASTMYHAE